MQDAAVFCYDVLLVFFDGARCLPCDGAKAIAAVATSCGNGGLAKDLLLVLAAHRVHVGHHGPGAGHVLHNHLRKRCYGSCRKLAALRQILLAAATWAALRAASTT